MASKIPFDVILDNVRCTVNKQELDRVHLLTKQDLYNIESEFGLDETVRHKNDAVSVDASVQEENMSAKSCVLLYKPQNEVVEQYTTFKKEDFALGIMTPAQEEMLRKFGSDCVCVDGTHGLNSYDFEVVTLMVIDDMRQGFPCAFFICSRIDSETVGTFFSFIKERLGDQLKPTVFMSDMADLFYNGWLPVMGPVEKRLYCTWHVDRAWQTNLTKIKEKEKRLEVYKKLRTLLQETDQIAFMKMLPSITDALCEDETTKEYGEYFKSYYSHYYMRWAYYYRINAGVNTNMHLESMHKTIKHLFLKGKTVKRLDRAIHAIMQMTKQKLFDRLTILEKGKLTSKLKDVRSRHKTSLEMDANLIVNYGNSCWEVASSLGQVYTVRLVNPDCNCRIECKHCSACIHRYSCTCIDACIKWNMCKHIHLLCRKLKSVESTATQNTEKSGDEVCNLQIDIDMSNTSGAEKAAILEDIGNTNTDNSSALEGKKMQLLDSFKLIVNQMESIEEVKTWEHAIKPLQLKLKPIGKDSNCLVTGPSFPDVKSGKSKNIDPQRRFLSLKKKKKARISKKPTSEECQQIALDALLPKLTTKLEETASDKSLPRLPGAQGSDDGSCSLRTSRCLRGLCPTTGTGTSVLRSL
ncbi:uncharacterized protein LOC124371503 [Homalodisca vitripennis]|uniref:uncharacterized protein LOC124371503 n=1 Tax=Homalodisca vitripennis TaxID=197043 RepID=UPI001EECACC6|nr:uncharacterized protein LOC124371503 [Homalodisca vitripennis]